MKRFQMFQRLSFFYVAALLIWFKTYIVQKLWFDLPVESLFQEWILLLTPVSSTLILLMLAVKLAKRHYLKASIAVSLATSGILMANVIYYRFFNDFITLPVFMQTNNVGDLAGSIFNLVYIYDLFIFIDTLLLIVVARKIKSFHFQPLKGDFKKIGLAALVILVVNLVMAEVVRPELMSRSFDRHILVKSMGVYNYHIYDLMLNSRSKSMKVFADRTDLESVYRQLEDNQSVPKSKYFGAGKGKNIILISMESLQSFVIDREIEGQEITPFLNRLIDESLYFENFYHQTGQGKTSDSEFIIDNSLYPLNQGAVFFTHAQNTYDAIPNVLKKHGYYSAVFHANDASFWNREFMYDALGYHQFFSKSSYSVNESNSVGWGLKDTDFFEQSIELMQTIPRPFYGKLITLTNHYPFQLSEEEDYISEYMSSSETLNRYVTTVSYMDEALETFFRAIIEEGLYDQSIFILYGDHYGISANHNEAMEELLGYPITPYEHVQLQRVPMIIHIPGMKGKTFETVTGQIDLRPTIMSLLGIEETSEITFGDDMLSPGNRSFTVLRDGSFISEEAVYTNGICYNRMTGAEIQTDACESGAQKASEDLQLSDEIIYGDLLRFKRQQILPAK